MKKRTAFILIFLNLFIFQNLLGDYWIKSYNNSFGGGNLIYDTKQGLIFSFNSDFCILDQQGNIINQTNFNALPLSKCIQLDDGSFIGIGSGNNLNALSKIGYNGEVEYSKNINFDVGEISIMNLCRVDNKIKVVGANKFNSDIIISDFSQDGYLLSSKKLLSNNSEYNIFSDNEAAVVEVGKEQYAIVKTGSFPKGGFALFVLDKNDQLVKVDIYSEKKSYSHPFIQKDMDNGYLVIVLKQSHDLCLSKFDSKFNLLWSREYIYDDFYMRSAKIEKVDDGYLIFFVNDTDKSKNELGILKIDEVGNVLESKKYGHEIGFLQDTISVPSGIVISTSELMFLVDNNGEIPGDCNLATDIYIQSIKLDYKKTTVNNDDFIIQHIDSNTENIVSEVINRGASYGDVLCEYKTMEGTTESILERSMFGAYFIHQLSFTVDPLIASSVKKFKIFTKGAGDFILVREIQKVDGQYSYVENFLKVPRYMTYRVVAVNENDEVISMVSFL